MLFIGTIIRLQVQEVSLKVGQAPRRRYDPVGIQSVPVLELNDGGVRGWTSDGAPVADVHHRDHAQSKSRGDNSVSLGFTSHYTAMRERFGDHVVDGIAAENILVTAGQVIEANAIAAGVVIVTAAGDEIRLDDVFPAAPCVEFSRYALRFPDNARPDETVTEAVRFLNDGIRGYYATYEGASARLALGDRVYGVASGK